MTKVDDEMALEFLRLSELGHTYVDIGKRFDVNHRTVSEWVRRGREFSRTRHWQQIGRDQDTRCQGRREIVPAGRSKTVPLNAAV